MKTIMKISTILLGTALLATSCIKEYDPQTSSATSEQVGNAPNALGNFISAITSTLCGVYQFGGDDYHYDLGGYPTFILHWGFMGQDMVPDAGSHMGYWYGCSIALGPDYLVCQMPWRYYYKWINNCNILISLIPTDQDGEVEDDERRAGLGLAHACRAFCYMDLARMYAPETYAKNPDAETVPLVTEEEYDMYHNPRLTNTEMWQFILNELELAEKFLDGYDRNGDKTKFDVSVVYAMKARAYLTMEDFANAEKYAKLAQGGYTELTEAQWLDRMTAFNTPNDAWIFCVNYDANSDAVLVNDSDSNYGSQMFLECDSGGLYASRYGDPKRIDAHLYQTIPATDYRKRAFIDPAIDECESMEEAIEFLRNYSDYPNVILKTESTTGEYGYLQLKFRAGGGAAGRLDSYAATAVSVPVIRVEEMQLIEIEALGMQPGKENEGIAALTAWAKRRDPQYTYNSMSSFRDNVWWQRRVELWGESAIATFDIKRLNKGIIRSYAGTNHVVDNRWNTDGVPQWMTLCIVKSETDFNRSCTQNPTPIAPTQDSPEYAW